MGTIALLAHDEGFNPFQFAFFSQEAFAVLLTEYARVVLLLGFHVAFLREAAPD